MEEIVDEALEADRLVEHASVRGREVGGAGVGPVDLDEIVLRESDALRARAHTTIDTRGVSGAQVVGDAGELTRAVRNLLDNAGRHAASTVTVTLAERNGAAVLVVADDGPGIPPDQAGRIFERFARADEARHRDDGGAGLGLAITHDIVAGHRGTITLDPAAAGGARFVVELPLAGPARVTEA